VGRKERKLALKHKEVLPSHFAGYVRQDDNKKLNRQRHEWIYKLRTKKEKKLFSSCDAETTCSFQEKERSESLTSQ